MLAQLPVSGGGFRCSVVPFLVKKRGVWAVLGGFRHPVAPQVVGRRQHLMGNPQISILIRS